MWGKKTTEKQANIGVWIKKKKIKVIPLNGIFVCLFLREKK